MASALRVAACRWDAQSASIVAEASVAAGHDLVIGSAPPASLVVPGWTGPPQLLIERGELVHVRPGMRVHMCGPLGEDRIKGTYEELTAAGVALPIPLGDRKLNMLR